MFPKGTKGQVWISNSGEWGGGPAGTLKLDQTKGNYYSPATMKVGAVTRSNATAERVYAVVADDVGAQIDPLVLMAELPEGAPDPFIVRTTAKGSRLAPGEDAGENVELYGPDGVALRNNEHWGWLAAGGIDVDKVDNPTLYRRLPQGRSTRNGSETVLVSDAGLKTPVDEAMALEILAAIRRATPGAKEAPQRPKPGKRGQKATLAEVEEVLGRIDNSIEGRVSYDDWIRTGIAVYGAIGEAGRDAFLKWSYLHPRAGVKFQPEDKWETFPAEPVAGFGALEILAKRLGKPAAAAFDDGADIFGVPAEEWKRPPRLEDFWAHMPTGKFISAIDDEFWPAISVDAQVISGKVDSKGKPVPASRVLRLTRPVHQQSWVPGQGRVVEGYVVAAGGLTKEPGRRIYNRYRPPMRTIGNAQATLPWTAHVAKMYPDEAEAIMDWLAFKVQFPGVKVNHALVLGGIEGIGKDMMLDPMRLGVGAWNFKEVAPSMLSGRFNQHAMAVVLRVNEAHDLGEGQTRRKFYEITKTLIAAPPEVLPIDQKGIEVYMVPNVVGVIITTNHKHDLYLPKSDRRHLVAWSNKTPTDMGGARYFNGLMKWLENGGRENVVQFLLERDLRKFDAKAPPRQTKAWRTIVAVSQGYEEEDAEDAFEALGKPDAVTWQDFVLKAGPRVTELLEKNNTRAVANIIDQAGYERIDNPANGRGRWRVLDMWIKIYVRKGLTENEKSRAADILHRRKVKEAEDALKKF